MNLEGLQWSKLVWRLQVWRILGGKSRGRRRSYRTSNAEGGIGGPLTLEVVHSHTCLFVLPIPPWSQRQRDMAPDRKLPHRLKHITPVSSALYPVFISLFPLAISLQLCSFLFRGTLILYPSLVSTSLSLSLSLQTSFFKWQSTPTLSTSHCCSLRLPPTAGCLPHCRSFSLLLPTLPMAYLLVVRCVLFSPYFTVYLSVLFSTIDSCPLPETSSSISFQNHIFSIFWAILMKSFSYNHIFLCNVPWKQTVG